MKLSPYLHVTRHPGPTDSLLLFSTKRTSKVVIPEAVFHAAQREELDAEQTELLARLGFLVADPEAEKAEMRRSIEMMNARRNAFRAIVMLNLDCNLDCPYCFEKDIRGNTYMSSEMAEKISAYIAERHAVPGRIITLDFYGGEALLSIGLIETIARPLRDLAEKVGATFSFNLVTNGTLLTRKAAEQLVRLGLKKVRVTLDGPLETHNRSRPFAGGTGSFDTIVENLLETHDLVQLQVGGNFTRENWWEFPRLLDILSGRGLTPDRLAAIQFAPVIAQGAAGCRDGQEGCISGNEEWVTKALLFLRKEILRRGYKTPKIAPAVCFAEYNSDFVITYDGTLYKCPGLVGRDEYAVGRIPDNPVESELYCPDIWKNDTCLDCKYLPLCFGGCRYLRVLQTGTIDGVDCKKDYYDAALDELLLQELRYGNGNNGG